MDNYYSSRFVLIKKLTPIELSALHTKEQVEFESMLYRMKNGTYESTECPWFAFGIRHMQELVKRTGGLWPKTADAQDRARAIETFVANIYNTIDDISNILGKLDILMDIQVLHDLDDVIYSKVPFDVGSSGPISLMERINASKPKEN